MPSIESVFDVNIVCPDNDASPSAPWLVERIKNIVSSNQQVPASPPVKFGSSHKDLTHNSKLLEKSNFDLEEILAKHQHTTLEFSSKL